MICDLSITFWNNEEENLQIQWELLLMENPHTWKSFWKKLGVEAKECVPWTKARSEMCE